MYYKLDPWSVDISSQCISIKLIAPSGWFQTVRYRLINNAWSLEIFDRRLQHIFKNSLSHKEVTLLLVYNNNLIKQMNIMVEYSSNETACIAYINGI